MIVNNLDVAGLVRRLRRFQMEIIKSASSSLAAVSVSDFTRAKSYLAALDTYINWVVAQPALDLPETAPKEIDLGEQEKFEQVDNEALLDLINLYEAAEVEIANSQSARMATGLINHDEKRIRAIIAKMNAFLDGYVKSILPLDLPESSPSQANSGHGKRGV